MPVPNAKARFFEHAQETTHQKQFARLRVIPGGRRKSDLKGEMRAARRIPIQCQLKIKTADHGETSYGVTKDLSVGGISFITDYVPRFGELLEIHMLPPRGSSIQPLRALVQVKRCIQVVARTQYEIGALILKIRE